MIKKIIYITILSLLFNACETKSVEGDISSDLINNPATAQNNAKKDDNLPFFEFTEEVKNFGEITQGEIVTTIFSFRNVGKSDLIISSAQGSCGCTVPEWPKEPIGPGEKGEIKIIFNSEGKQGAQNKTVTLVANTQPSTVKIALKGTVLVP